MLFKMFVVFEIYDVNDRPGRFGPKNPLLHNIWPQIYYVQIDIVMINISCSMIDNKMSMV